MKITRRFDNATGLNIPRPTGDWMPCWKRRPPPAHEASVSSRQRSRSANRSSNKTTRSYNRLSNSSRIEAACGSGYSGAEEDCGSGENLGFARSAYVAWILQGIHIHQHFAWPNHSFSEIAVGKAAELLHLLWSASEAEEYVNIIYNLP